MTKVPIVDCPWCDGGRGMLGGWCWLCGVRITDVELPKPTDLSSAGISRYIERMKIYEAENRIPFQSIQRN